MIQTKTERLINRIKEKESFFDIAYLCEDFATFCDEVAEWGVDHAGGVDFDDPDLDIEAINDFFNSFGYTMANPHPAGRYA
tara:strand:+ start:1980 stop:2222 length:243 start_codon:yes stop_codon:yes gene_type:complete